MSKILLLVSVFFVFTSCLNESKKFVITGRVTDFNGKPIDSATIRLKNRAFENLYETLSDSNGNYFLEVNKGNYYCMYVIKLSEYRVNRLEYWAWNVPVYEDMVINPQYDRMEIYGINVFEPQVTPQETYMLYFRPMSLSKTLQIASKQEVDKNEFQKARQAEDLLKKNNKLIKMSPDSITSDELKIEINGVEVKVVGINKTTEYARGILMYGYCVQVLKATNYKEQLDLKYDRISITLRSSETGETGKGETFIKR
ncbi:MAG: carboxypeptidase-like regulatory domain-containing protein [Bacteroidota bacterium]